MDDQGYSLDPADGVEHACAEAWTFVEQAAEALRGAARGEPTSFAVPPSHTAMAGALAHLDEDQWVAVQQWMRLAAALSMRHLVATLESGVGPFAFDVLCSRDALTQAVIGADTPPGVTGFAESFWGWLDHWRGG